MPTFKEAFKLLKASFKWLKYSAVILYADLTRRSVVNLFGSTYVVYGDVVKRIK